MSAPNNSTPPARAKDDQTTAPLVRVVDDEVSIQALLTSFGRIGGFDVAAYGTGTELLTNLDEERPGCLVVDLYLPDRTGIDVLQELARRRCRLPVVFMSGMARVAEAVKALKLGSLDFVEKPFDVTTMMTALRQAIAQDLRRRSEETASEAIQQRFARLTERESEVMELVCSGAANKEVAAKLGLSPKTVEIHRANVMRKTGSASLAELVRLHMAR